MINQSFQPLSFAMLEHFRESLDKQEAKLADALLLATIPPIGKDRLSGLHLHGSGHFRLSQALSAMTTRIKNLHEGQVTQEEWEAAVNVINPAFWDYVEVLEGASEELFHHMDEVDLGAWSENFYQVTAAFKELLAHRMEDLRWVYKRVEDLMLAYRHISQKKKNIWVLFGRFLRRFSSVLDKAIVEHLSMTEEVLNTHYKTFQISYNALKVLIPEIQEKETKFAQFPVFVTLDKVIRDFIIKLYRLASLNEKNRKLKTLDSELLAKTVKNLGKPGQSAAYFRDYIEGIKRRFFELCKQWHQTKDKTLQKPLSILEKESADLQVLIGSYREILLRSQTVPYAKTRWTFTEWIVGKEPRKTRDLLLQLYQLEGLAKLFPALNLAIEKKGDEKDEMVKRGQVRRQMQEVLHEMGQPLSSRNLIQIKAERLIELLDVADELGGSHGDVHELINNVLLKAFRFDSKHQVLGDYPRFHELIAIHKGLSKQLYDIDHEKRYKLFNAVIKHVEHWLKNREVDRHISELEVDEAAVYESLQNFLAEIKRSLGGDLSGYLQMLLEYRYLFSQFFHFLRSYEGEGKILRSQFAFVDSYLDAAEQEIKNQPLL